MVAILFIFVSLFPLHVPKKQLSLLSMCHNPLPSPSFNHLFKLNHSSLSLSLSLSLHSFFLQMPSQSIFIFFFMHSTPNCSSSSLSILFKTVFCSLHFSYSYFILFPLLLSFRFSFFIQEWPTILSPKLLPPLQNPLLMEIAVWHGVTP